MGRLLEEKETRKDAVEGVPIILNSKKGNRFSKPGGGGGRKGVRNRDLGLLEE